VISENIFHGCSQLDMSPVLFIIQVQNVLCTDDNPSDTQSGSGFTFPP
jgi:hypothetical protein